MKLTEAKLKALILETMEEEGLDKKQKEDLLSLLRHDDPASQIQGVEFAASLVDPEDFGMAFRSQLDYVNGAELLKWLRQGSSRGPRKALDKFMIVPNEMSKEKREFQLRFPMAAWQEPISDEAHETWADRVQQMQSGLVKAGMAGDFYEWEDLWSKFKDLLGSFYEIHAPGFWDSLTDSEQMDTIYNRNNKPGLSKKSFDKAQGIFDPRWRLAEPLAKRLSRVKRDWYWSEGYSDKYDEDLETPKEPNNPKYMEGWQAAIDEIDEESRGW